MRCIFICFSAWLMLLACVHESEAEDRNFNYMTEPISKATDSTASSRKLVEYTKKEFLKKEIINVGTNIHVAIGFGLGNSIMIEGNDGLIIFDTTESVESMAEIMAEFRKVTAKPVKAIVLSHFHSDHISGTSYVLTEGRARFPNITIDIYSHYLTKGLMRGFSDTYDIGIKRGLRMFGSTLPKIPEAITGAGLGPEIRMSANTNLYIPDPTVTFKKRATYTVAGIRFQLIHTPGETEDQITMYLPKEQAVFPGDNFYKTFPNLYTIRGAPARDSKQWYESLDIVKRLGAKYLAGSHSQPIIGKAAVRDALQLTRDAIKFVHDQTVRLMNKGYFPGQIVEELKLPDRLENHPNLQQHYGAVPWCVRGVFTNYLGWFSGNPVNLDPMSDSDHAARMIRLVQYARASTSSPSEIILQHAQISHLNSVRNYETTGKHILSNDKWALELADLVIENRKVDEGLVQTAKIIKASALRAIGVEHISANGRNYYLTYANEVQYDLSLDRTRSARAFVVKTSTIDRVLAMLCAKVDGLTCQSYNYSILVDFTDKNKAYGLTLRNSVCDVIKRPKKTQPQVRLSMSSETFQAIAAEERNLDAEVTNGNVVVEKGALDTYKNFLKCFDSMLEP